ncbi:hypothetical protein TNCV_184121 [Trichonephila clavipes]|nr:hypothetical protein TNCV_184121 [Trichonephila clavipes]
MQAMDLLDQDIEEHFLKNVFNPQEGLPRVHFKTRNGAHTSKNQDPPENLRQLALRLLTKFQLLQCKFIPTVAKTKKLMWQSVLIAIDEALRIIKTMTSPDEIWILCDAEVLSNTLATGDKCWRQNIGLNS